MKIPPVRTWSRTLHRRVVYPLVLWARGEQSVFSNLDELQSLETLSANELRIRQNRRLHAMLEYAGQRCRRYRSLLNTSTPPAPSEAREWLTTLPLLEKQELQGDPEALRAVPPPSDRISRKTTGGSTGQPVTVTKNRSGTAWNRATFWYGVGWNGVRIGDRGARFWGSPGGLGRRRWSFWAADVAMNRLRFSAFAFDEEDLEAYWKQCLLFKPDYFYGYVSMLETFARHLEESGHDGSRLGLKSIVTTAEVLGDPHRELLEDVFGVPVQNEYGCGEVGPIAYECAHRRLHVMTENVCVELLTETGEPALPGETGEVVVTDLHNRAMPLLRYRLGDFAVRGAECGCGRSYPVIEKVWGREYEFVVTPDGRKMHGEYFLYLFEDLRDDGIPVDQFQVTQVDQRRLDVAVVSGEGLSEGDLHRIRRGMKFRLEKMEVRIREVGRIDRAASGKLRVVRNEWSPSQERE